jgi:hypothetical protein
MQSRPQPFERQNMYLILLAGIVLSADSTQSAMNADSNSAISISINTKNQLQKGDSSKGIASEAIKNANWTLGDTKDLVTIFSILGALVMGYHALFRTVKSDIFKRIYEDDSKRQMEIQAKCYDLIEEFQEKYRHSGNLPRGEIQNIFDKLRDFDRLASHTRSPIANASFVIKETVRNILKYYNEDDEAISNDFAFSVIRILEFIRSDSQKHIMFPSFFSFVNFTKSTSMKFGKLTGYVAPTKHQYYTFYQAGLDLSPASHEAMWIYNELLELRSNIVLKAICKVLRDPHPVAAFLISHRIYSPLTLTTSIPRLPDGKGHTFSLVGFSKWKRHSFGKIGIRDYCKFIYVLDDDFASFADGVLSPKSFSTNKDPIIDHDLNDFKIHKLIRWNGTTISIETDTEISNEMFLKAQKKLARYLKSNIKGNKYATA